MDTRSQKLTDCCPTGHRVRGDASLTGQTVRCPSCQVTFVFGAPKPVEKREVTESSVMRILGDFSPEAAPAAADMPRFQTRPCPKCKLAISETAAVCGHCNCYVGAMPSFMRELA